MIVTMLIGEGKNDLWLYRGCLAKPQSEGEQLACPDRISPINSSSDSYGTLTQQRPLKGMLFSLP